MTATGGMLHQLAWSQVKPWTRGVLHGGLQWGWVVQGAGWQERHLSLEFEGLAVEASHDRVTLRSTNRCSGAACLPERPSLLGCSRATGGLKSLN
jgi:hypothetical protein